MDERTTGVKGERQDGLPGDVQRLYEWANLQHGGYRDFSGVRRAYRAEVRASRESGSGVAPVWEVFAARTSEPAVATLPDAADVEMLPEAVVAGNTSDPYEPEVREVPVTDTYDELDGVAEPVSVAVEPAGVMRVPVVAVFSLAGGTGKTSLVATLGRALSSVGEEVELIETAAEGLLPYYFGTSDLRPGTVRTFAPPPGSTHAPVHLLSYDVALDGGEHETLLETVTAPGAGVRRVLLDLNGPWGSVLRQVARVTKDASGLTVLVPVAPDLSSVLRLHAMERYLHGLKTRDGEWVLPYYVLNRYDGDSTLHAEIREMLAGQLGERLLPFTVRYDLAVGEAFGGRMTVIDLRPRRAVAEDYLALARWVAEKVPA